MSGNGPVTGPVYTLVGGEVVLGRGDARQSVTRPPKLGTTSGFLRLTAFVGSMREREQRGSRMQLRTVDAWLYSRW